MKKVFIFALAILFFLQSVIPVSIAAEEKKDASNEKVISEENTGNNKSEIAKKVAKKKKTDETFIPKKSIADGQTIIPLTNENYLLEGLVDGVHFYYEVPVDRIEGDNDVYLHVRYSDLLLKGSTITVSVDGEPVKSVALTEGKKEQEITVPLSGKAVERGFHHITVSFYGEITTEMCANEENPANWLTILSDSHVQLALENGLADRENMLADYPYPFIQYDENKQIRAKIVIPDDASTAIASAALQVANFLSEQTLRGEKVDIIFEKDVKEIDSHMIAIGAVNEWNGVIAKQFKSLDAKVDSDKLAIFTEVFSISKKDKQIMFVTATDDKQIADLIPILTEEAYVKQLTNNHLQLEKLPVLKQEKVVNTIPFKKMRIPTITLNGIESASEFYFYELPTYVDVSKTAYVHVKFKMSETLLHESKISTDLGELVVHINGVPHSVSLRDIEVDSDGFYRVAIPVSESTLQAQRMMSIQFAGHGLQEREICVPPADDKWIFIEDSSYMEFSTVSSTVQEADFYTWPEPFIGNNEAEKTLIVIPEELSTEILKQVQWITSSLRTKGSASQIQMVAAKDVTEEELKENNIIVAGNLSAWDGWQAYAENLLIPIDEAGTLRVDEFGFITETAKHASFIQPSLWNEANVLAVFAPVHKDGETFVSEKLMEDMQQKKLHVNVIVESEQGDIFTYELDDVEKEITPEIESERVNQEPWMFYLFIGIFIIAVLIFILVLRRIKGVRPHYDRKNK